MKNGRLKVLDLPINIEEIASATSQRTLDGEHEWALTVSLRGQTDFGHEFATGYAALRKEVDRDVARVSEKDDGVTISPTVRHSHVTMFGEWVAVDDGWLVVSDEWVAGVVGTQVTGHPEDVELNLQDVLEQFDSPSVYQVGFAGRSVADGGSRGALYGSNVTDDPDLGEELEHTPLNELGVDHSHRSVFVKSYLAAKTGYVEVYDSEFTTRQFIDYCSQWVVDHIKGNNGVHGRGSSESEEAGEEQACEICPRETESVQKTIVDDGSVVKLCIVCRDYYYENGELPGESGDSEEVEA